MIHTEVLIVGGGPAGAACAGKLKQEGRECLILDKQVFPRAKPCAGWITPGVLQDVRLSPAEYPGSFTRFRAFRIAIGGLRFTLPTRQYAIRRVEFDDWLLKQAQVEVIQHAVGDIRAVDDGYVVDGMYAAKYLIGAGGTYCPVRRVLFNDIAPRCPEDQIVALEEEFAYPGNNPQCHLWFGQHNLPGYAWYVPKAGGFVNVGVGGKVLEIKRHGDSIRRHWQMLIEQLERLGLVRQRDYQPAAHTYYLLRRSAICRRGNALLVGDAAGLATQDMGEGIAAAIRSGTAAAGVVLKGGAYDLRRVPRLSSGSLLCGR